MSDYIGELRKLIGSRPIIACSACVIITDDAGRIVLQRRGDNGLWALPGGAMEIGEDLEQTAKREAQEEVGLLCANLEFHSIHSGPYLYCRYPNGDEIYNVVTAFICRDFSGTLIVDEQEATEARFFAPSELPADINPIDKIVLDGYLPGM